MALSVLPPQEKKKTFLKGKKYFYETRGRESGV